MNTSKLVLSLASFVVDGVLNVSALDQAYAEEKAKLQAFLCQDQDTVSLEMSALLMAPKYVNTTHVPLSFFVEGIYLARLAKRIQDGGGMPDAEETAAEKEHLETVIRAIIANNPDQYHNGKRGGIAVRYVLGDFVKENGNDVIGDDGYPVVRMRISDLDWAKIDVNRAISAQKKEAKKAAKEAEILAKVPVASTFKPNVIRRAASVVPNAPESSAPLSNAAE